MKPVRAHSKEVREGSGMLFKTVKETDAGNVR